MVPFYSKFTVSWSYNLYYDVFLFIFLGLIASLVFLSSYLWWWVLMVDDFRTWRYNFLKIFRWLPISRVGCE